MNNLIKINKDNLGFEELRDKPTLEEMRTATVVFVEDNGFNAQLYDGSNSTRLYYIPKNKTVYTREQFVNFAEKHLDELFMLVTNKEGHKYDVWAYIDSTPGNLKLTFFTFNSDTGTMVEIASMRNNINTCIWDKESIVKNDDFVSDFSYYNRQYGYDDYDDSYWQINFKTEYRDRYRTINTFAVVGEKPDAADDTSNFMIKYLNLPGKTRIVSMLDYHRIAYCISVGEDAMADITTRYGIKPPKNDYDWRYNYVYMNEAFDNGADLDESTWERIKNHISKILKDGFCNNETIGRYNHQVSIKTKAMIVISAPVNMHRRPTYHYIKGFMNNGVIDVVELAKGELLIKDMTPVNCYYLCSDGRYVRVSRNLFGDIKSTMINAEIDKVSFTEWNESKSIHPELLKAVTNAGDAIHLTKIKLFNRIPFGALYLEHLIKGSNYKLAEEFAEYITERSDNMNYTCGSLSDIFSGCNPDGTSLMKVLNMNKPCLDLLMKYSNDGVNKFIKAYNAIKTLIPEGNLTKDTNKIFSQYMELCSMNWATYNCRTGRVVDIINYPNEIKSVYKMINKIRNAFGANSYEPLRHYQEIVMAYFQFKDFGWDPAESQIFIEFGLGDLSEAREMIRDREHAANTALGIYYDKIDELAHQEVEKHYAHRRHILNKIVSTGKMAKESKSGLLKEYSVVAPTQIYGEDVVGSIEKEGLDMNHCVFRSYAGKIAEGKYTVLYLRLANSTDTSLVTIGITQEGRINQTFGVNDNYITKEQAEAIAEWATNRKGMVTFKSEHKDVAPGGWPKGVEIPVLPEPDADWLKKLAEIE